MSHKIASEFPGNRVLLMDSGAWLLSAAGTSRDISDRLGITGQQLGPSVIVFTISGYYGRAPNNVWEWLKAEMESGARA